MSVRLQSTFHQSLALSKRLAIEDSTSDRLIPMTQVALPLKSPAGVIVSNSASKASDQVLTAGNLALWEQIHAVESSV